MADRIKQAFPDATVDLQGGGRGDFIVTADDRELWNKNASGRGFPSEDEIVRALGG